MKILQKYVKIKTVENLKKAMDKESLFKLNMFSGQLKEVFINHQYYNYEELQNKLLYNFYYRKNNKKVIY